MSPISRLLGSGDSLYISVLTIGEIRKGVESVVAAARKEKLRVWLEHSLPDWFQERVWPLTNLSPSVGGDCWP
ncbi:MAG: hypothetical protein Q9M24_02380, partial [Mariprofundaceae bacterium]|nr:hypothetical protein [Mariprofundaceae bacterium]